MYDAIEVLSSGLSVARQRVNLLASNIANAETTRTPDGGPYKRKDLVQVGNPSASRFASALDKMTLASPQVQAVIEDNSAPKMVFKPGHPDANEEGYVAMPNINVVSTMTDMMSATRAYSMMAQSVENMRRMLSDAARISIRF
jgi:flagellar basal-body rod protein FlgC